MKNKVSELSPRQQQIVRLISRGYVDKQIAAELGIALQTVRSTLQTIFQRTGAQNRLGLICRLFKLTEK